MKVSYRSGRTEDCPVLAKLVNIASEGVIEFLFHGLVAINEIIRNVSEISAFYIYPNISVLGDIWFPGILSPFIQHSD